MKFSKKSIFISMLLVVVVQAPIATKSGLTFNHNHGRLGDVLLDYTKNFYIAYKYDLELYIHDGIPYLTDFVLYDETARFSHRSLFARCMNIADDKQIDYVNDNTLFTSNLYVTVDGISDFNVWHAYMFTCSIEQPVFGQTIKRRLTPKQTFELTLPKDTISIAMHIRKGGGFDCPLASEQYYANQKHDDRGIRIDRMTYVDRSEPFKFPPEQYYVDQLMWLYKFLDEQPLYVFIFTDDRDPATIAQRIAQKVNKHNITFDYRTEKNAHNLNVIKDMYLMSKFDYLIRSNSHYPWAAQMIGDHKAIMSPVAYRWDGDYLNIITAEIAFPDRENHSIKRIVIDKQ